MKKVFLVIILTISLFAKGALMPENTVAVVNGMALSKDDLQIQINILIPKSSYHASVKPESAKKLKVKAMKALIDSTLLYQYALSLGIKGDNSIMDGVYKKLIKAYHSDKAIDIELKKIGLNLEMLKKLYMRDSVQAQLYKKEIEEKITNSELKEYYEKNRYKFKMPEQVRVSLIYVKNDPTDPKGRSKGRAKAEEALKKIKAGEDFGEVAEKYSNAMSRIKGGDMGLLHKGRLNESVEVEAYRLKKGEMSGIIEKDVGFFIVKVTDKKEPKQLSFEKIKTSLLKDLKKKRETRKKEDLLNMLRAKAKIIK